MAVDEVSVDVVGCDCGCASVCSVAPTDSGLGSFGSAVPGASTLRSVLRLYPALQRRVDDLRTARIGNGTRARLLSVNNMPTRVVVIVVGHTMSLGVLQMNTMYDVW